MGKLLVVLSVLIIGGVAMSLAQGPAQSALTEAQVSQHSNRVLAVVSSRVLTGNFTAEQQQAVVQVLEETTTGLQNCESTLLWQYKVCSAVVLRNALRQVNALQLVASPEPGTA